MVRLRVGCGLRGWVWVLLGLAGTLPLRPAGAQSVATDAGVLSGRVLDASGRPVEGARVSLESGKPVQPGTPGSAAVERAVRTDKLGEFVFLRLRAGSYRVSLALGSEVLLTDGLVDVDASEAARAELRVVSGKPGIRAALSLRAPPGSLAARAADTEELLPSLEESPRAAESSPGERADTPEETEEHATGSTVPEPGAEPGADPIVSGAPAVLSSRVFAAGGAGAGTGSAEAGSTLDGLSLEQGFRTGARGAAAGGPVSGATFARRAVGSLRVMPRTYSAGAGGLSGGEVAVGTRAGAAGVHGGAFATLRVSALDAANPYAVMTHYRDGVISGGVVKPQDTDVQAGAHVGFAPIGKAAGAWRERVLGFVSLEGRERKAPVEATPAVASFYALTPMQRALLGTRGVTASQVNTALNYLDGLTGEIARSDTRLLSFGRVDFRGGGGRADQRDAVAVTFAGNHFRSPAGAAFDQLADAVVARGRGSVGDSALDVEAVAGHWAHAFSSRLENTVRAQWVSDVESEQPRAPLAAEPAISPGGQAPEVQIAPQGFAFGTAANLDRRAYPDERRVQVADTLLWAPSGLLGRHVLRVGGDWSRVADRVDSLRNGNGTFLYDSGDVNGRAGGLVDWITDATFNVRAYPNGGCPSIAAAVHDFCFRTYTQSFGTAQQQFATHEFAGFVEDSFFAGADLRVTLGARYEYTLLPLPQVPNAGLDASLRGLSLAGQLPGQLAGATSAFPEDRNNAGPRVGVAWSPHAGKWFTARAGYGWFFGRLPGTTLRAALADNGLATGISQVRITPTTETACPQVANQGFGYLCAFAGAPPSAVAQTGTVVLFAERFRLPAVQRGSLTVERALGRHFVAELGYAGAVATQLPTSVDVNIAPAAGVARFALQGGADVPGLAAGRTFSLPLYTARRLANVGPVTAITSQANASYHAGTVEARMEAWHGVAARASVTYSRTIDDNPQSGAGMGSGPRVNGMFDPFAIGYDKGLSDLQAPLRFAASLVARTELRQGPRAVQAGLSGWRVAASATASSGAPYSYEIFGGTRLPGGHASINGSGGSTYLPTVGRNTLRLPPRAKVDLRLERGTTVRGLKVSGFAEAFNVFNQRNLSRVETRAFLPGAAVNGVTPLVFQDAAAVASEGVTTPAFGTAVSSTGGLSRERLVAVGLRVEF